MNTYLKACYKIKDAMMKIEECSYVYYKFRFSVNSKVSKMNNIHSKYSDYQRCVHDIIIGSGMWLLFFYNK